MPFLAPVTYSNDDASVIQSASFSIFVALDQIVHFRSRTVIPWGPFLSV